MKGVNAINLLIALGTSLMLGGIIAIAISASKDSSNDSTPPATPLPTTAQPSVAPTIADPSVAPTSAPTLRPSVRSPTSPPSSVNTLTPTIDTLPSGDCPLCANGAVFQANRTVYRQGENPISCAELQKQAANDTSLCADIERYRFYCGCAGVLMEDVSCGLCPSGNSTPFEERVLFGFAPTFVPAEEYTCSEAQRQLSLLTDNATCADAKRFLEDAPTLCGCNIASPRVPCSALCLDETLIPQEFWEKPALIEQDGFGTLNCYEYQLLAVEGDLSPRDCNAANYVGLKHCGCQLALPFCDLCEDGTPVTLENLSRQIFFETTCLDVAGDSLFRDPEDELCPTFQNTLGEYCGCDNPIASEGACRVCSEPPGEVVPDSNQTLLLQGFELDCGELEFSGNNPNGFYTCDDAQLFGSPCCGNVTGPVNDCPICESGDNLLFPGRTVYQEGLEPITCAALQEQAGSDAALCADLSKYRFYCGCASVAIEEVSCGLCGPGNSTPFENRLLPGFAPDYIPADEYTCGEVQRQLSLITDTVACDETKGIFEDILTLCGCILPPIPDGFLSTPCTSLCLDGTLIPQESWENPALQDQPGFGTLSCYEYQLLTATGTLEPAQCDASQYVGLKSCGCQTDLLFCDLCEDGTPVAIEHLARQVTFERTCLTWAGLAYFYDVDDELCPAFQSTAGVYCGCDNSLANDGACRICDVDGGEVVPESNLTIIIDAFATDCGEMEFITNTPDGEFDCERGRELAIQCCENAPSVAPTASPFPTVTLFPTFTPTA